MEKGKKFTFSLKARLLLIGLVPALVMSITLMLFASSSIRTGMQEEALNGLRGAALALQQIYDTADAGDYAMDDAGNVVKGELVVSGSYDIVDALYAETEYHVTVFYGDTRVSTSLKDSSGSRLVGTQASDIVIQTVLNGGKEYSDTAVVINGEPYYGYYVPVEQNGSVVGMVFAGLPSEDTDAFIQEKVMATVGISLVLLLIIAVLTIFFATTMARGIVKAKEVIHELRMGNLKVKVDERAKRRSDETGVMTRELEILISELSKIISNVKQSSKVLFDSGSSLEEMAAQSSSTTNEISRAVEDISRGAMTQAEETETASANIVEMGNVITEIVASVDSLGISSLNMKNASDESTVIIQELSLSNDKTTEAIAKIGQQVYTTNDSVQSIRQAVELITSIAAETNLLSLNASIEAARAGEHGRGFAVVASQIQKLAEESNNSAQEIGKIIDNLLKESEHTVQVMEEVNVIIKEQGEKLTETKDKFVLVTNGVNSTRKETEVIQNQAGACDAARAKIMDVIQNLSAISEENAASTEETNASMEELNATLSLLAEAAKDLLDLSTDLEKNMEFFKV